MESSNLGAEDPKQFSEKMFADMAEAMTPLLERCAQFGYSPVQTCKMIGYMSGTMFAAALPFKKIQPGANAYVNAFAAGMQHGHDLRAKNEIVTPKLFIPGQNGG